MEASVFITLVITAITEAIRLSSNFVNGAVTIVVAALVGVGISLVDVSIGLTNISIAEGVTFGLAAAGIVAIAKKV